ncbi:MAG: indole-3-glycerol phosphate synthase TrpC [Bryobacteraceae bacterium]|jgi:indole-3-glycerol phosphate synthase
MVKAVPDILARIVGQKKAEQRRITSRLESEAEESVKYRRDFAAALTRTRPAIISEIKKASPSRGVLTANFDPAATAKAYEDGGAAALSVLTDGPNFQGSLDDLKIARVAVTVPVLRKDFTIGEFDAIEAAAAGADAILLIAAILDEKQLRDYRELAARYGMAALVEVHNEEELAIAVASGATIIGVNNRNLHTFDVSLDVARRLAEHMPQEAIRVAESGIHSAADVHKLTAAGYTAFLVGEHLMKSGDPSAALQALLA